MSKAGNFEIDTSGGYPVWCDIYYCGERCCRVRHDELSDLKYAVEKAMQEACRNLPDRYKEEV